MAPTELIAPLLLYIVIGIVVLAFVVSLKGKSKTKGRYQSTGRIIYVPGQFSAQMELDMRLPYKRFKQLYPNNPWTYQEYKQMQMKTAFRRSTSSEQNKRMVR